MYVKFWKTETEQVSGIGWGQEEGRRIIKGNFWSTRYVHCLSCGDSFTGAYVKAYQIVQFKDEQFIL